MHWRRKWQPTPVFLPGESQGRGSLVGCCLWGHTELDMTEAMQQQQWYKKQNAKNISVKTLNSTMDRFNIYCCYFDSSVHFRSLLEFQRIAAGGQVLLHHYLIPFCLHMFESVKQFCSMILKINFWGWTKGFTCLTRNSKSLWNRNLTFPQ